MCIKVELGGLIVKVNLMLANQKTNKIKPNAACKDTIWALSPKGKRI